MTMDLQGELRRQLDVFGLPAEDRTLRDLLTLQEELLRWNRTYNLTAVTDPVEALEKHLVDSLTLLPYLGKASTLLDIGSGAGFPGLPIKICRPELRVVSVDSVAKKIRFQKHIVRRIGLREITPWHGRAEDMPDQPLFAPRFDLVVARAFSSITKLLDLALPCLGRQGRVVVMKGPEGERELAAARPDLDAKGVRCGDIVRLTLPASGAVRQLLFLER